MSGSSDLLVLDGAAGTYLESKGAALHQKLWSSGALLSPDGHALIQDLHNTYINAGADIITTVTYQASIPGLIAAGISEVESSELITRAVYLAREEADRHKPERIVKVAGGLGPYGAFLSNGEEYTGNYGCNATREVLRDFWIPRAKAVLSGEPDILLFETVPNLSEIEVIVNEVAPLARAANVPVWISLSLKIPEHRPDSAAQDAQITLADGSPISKVGEVLNSSGAYVQMIGANCFDVREVSRVIDALKPVNRPILLYPNSGEIYDGHDKTWHSPRETDSGQLLWNPTKWHARGVNVLGGCCRTTPDTISQIRSTRASGAEF